MTDSFENWVPRARPGSEVLRGQYTVVEPFQPDVHLGGLFSAICGAENDGLWDYIPYGPFTQKEELRELLKRMREVQGWETQVIKSRENGEILGMFSLMRIRREHGSAEVGCVIYGPKLARTRMATEAIYLLGVHLFDRLGYRRFEWKCNNENGASKRAALRYGFHFEGVFRNDLIVKGRNRDTAWYAMTDDDWKSVKPAYETWLQPANFDQSGKQLRRLDISAAV